MRTLQQGRGSPGDSVTLRSPVGDGIIGGFLLGLLSVYLAVAFRYHNQLERLDSLALASLAVVWLLGLVIAFRLLTASYEVSGPRLRKENPGRVVR